MALARYWNRPMGSWRPDFMFELTGLIVLCIIGSPYSYVGMGIFSLLTCHWTWRTIQGYRRGERAGSHHRHYNRDDIWKDGPNG